MTFWHLLIVLLAILVLWWALTRQASFTESQTHSHTEHEVSHTSTHPTAPQAGHDSMPVEALETRTEQVSLQTAPDDLKIIEGIGPKIASVLTSAGISTFSVLAATDPAKIKTILSAADERLGRISDPTSWPEQASLAAKGDIDGLQKLQDNLKGGRKQ
jgi:predicted flap endonuclease-1-like 5' DNA nuclease